jgi:hypothetical protein
MPTITTAPVSPVSGIKCTVVFTLTHIDGEATVIEAGNYIRVWCVIAPTDSELDKKLKADALARVLVFEGDAPIDRDDVDELRKAKWHHKFDKGGKYTFVVQNYSLPAEWGGGYQGDIRAYQTDANGNPTAEKKEDVEQTVTLYVAQKLTSPIGAGTDRAELTCVVKEATIIETTLATHGIVTPAIVNPKSDRARAAIDDSNVQTALSGLKNSVAVLSLGTLSTIVSDIRSKQNAHNTSVGVHNTGDSTNAILSELASDPTPKTLMEFVNAALLRMRRHRLNDNGNGTASAAYHQISGNGKADFKYTPLFQSVSTPEDAYAALADLWRCHEGHRTNTAVHSSADVTNVLSVSSPILLVHKRFLEALAASAANPSPADSSAASLLRTWGWKDS